MENLPLNYSRVFQFQSFERTRRRILAEAAAEEEGAMVKKKKKKKLDSNSDCRSSFEVLRWVCGVSDSVSVSGGLVRHAAYSRRAVFCDGERAVGQTSDAGVSLAP